jgi:hypothetical protein
MRLEAVLDANDALEPSDLAFRSIETFVASLSRRISYRVRPAINSSRLRLTTTGIEIRVTVSPQLAL